MNQIKNNKMKKLLLIFFVNINVSLYADNIDLFIWAGQSNALGRQGDAASYPADVDNFDNLIRFNWTVANGSNSGGWTTMQPQIGYFPTGHFGPEVTFSRKLTEVGYNPAIFKYTQSGTSIFQHWQGPGDGGLYDDLVTTLNMSITALENQGHTVTVKGFIWIQGESDSNSQNAATVYQTNLTNIINDIRNNVVGNPNLPVLLGVDEQYFYLVGQDQPEILNAHQDIALNDVNIKFTSMYGYPKADATHLTPAGLINQGIDMFDSYELLVANQSPLESCVLSSDGDNVSILARSWGQSFTTDCSGYLSSLSFSSASNLSNSATVTLSNGADCGSTILLTYTLNEINMGNNTIYPTTNLYLEKEHTYYLNITSDDPTTWRVHYSDGDNVFGILKTNIDGDGLLTCRRPFLTLDMNFSIVISASTDCADVSNIYSFTHNNVNYEVVKENRTWQGAASCAAERGGFLAEINDVQEQNAIYNELQNNAGITVLNTVASDGGNASYIWIGANDINTEGDWYWDGDNDGVGSQFWQGGSAASGGVVIGGLYNNWGNEPDNSGNAQDAAGIAITQWPIGSGSLGSAGQWNDVNKTNALYYIIEYPVGVNLNETKANTINVYPNPVNNLLTIEGSNVTDIKIVNSLGQLILNVSTKDILELTEVDFSNVEQGIYYAIIKLENGNIMTKKVIK